MYFFEYDVTHTTTLESTVNKRHQLMAGMHNKHIIYYISILL